MSNKKMTIGMTTILFTGFLAAFYWAEIFPSQYKIMLVLMLIVWLFQMTGILLFIQSITSNMEGFGRISLWVLGGFLVLASLLYCIESSTQNNDRDLVKDFLIKGDKIELYHLDRHDHTAIEIFYGTNGLLANRYFKDHFTIKNTNLNGEILLIKNAIQAEEIMLDVGKMKLEFYETSK